jgi:hypothetical protein
MPKFRKKPVVVDAWDTTVEFPTEARTRLAEIAERPGVHSSYEVYDELHDTWVKFEKGDWVIRGVRGEFYPCKRDVFEATYEPK